MTCHILQRKSRSRDVVISSGNSNFFLITSELIGEFGPSLGLPYTKALGDDLFEIRAKGKEGIGRSFFCTMKGQEIIILHSFIKKSQKTPKKELKTAQTRLKAIRKKK